MIGVDYSPISDFNLAITLDENNATFKAAGFRHSLCQPNGEDLRFQSSSGSELKYDIASWNKSGKSIIWLQVPSLVRNDKIMMRWGMLTPPRHPMLRMDLPGRIILACIILNKMKD